jgi:hypothetical protein
MNRHRRYEGVEETGSTAVYDQDEHKMKHPHKPPMPLPDATPLRLQGFKSFVQIRQDPNRSRASPVEFIKNASRPTVYNTSRLRPCETTLRKSLNMSLCLTCQAPGYKPRYTPLLAKIIGFPTGGLVTPQSYPIA